MRVCVERWQLEDLVIREAAPEETGFDIPDELFIRYGRCLIEFQAVQEKLEALYDAQRYHLVATPDPSGGGDIV